MVKGKSSRRGLKICCGVTAISVVIVAAVVITLAFTVFKPKAPIITVYPQGLNNLSFGVGGFSFLENSEGANVSLGVVLAINNPNYGSFKFKNTTGSVNYHGEVVAEVPIYQSLVPAHSKLNISTHADLMVQKLISNPFFFNDALNGSINLTSEAIVHGKVTVFNILKLHATVPNRCNISVFVRTQNIMSTCKTGLKVYT